MASEKFEFPGHDGQILNARLDLPNGKVEACALFAHCFTCSKDIPAARRISERLAAQGIAVLRFDFTGLGHSKGEFANTNFSTNVADLHAASQALAARGLPPQLLIGHSLGGSAVLKAAPDISSLRAVVTIGAPADPAHVAHHFSEQVNEIHQSGRAHVQLAGRTFEITRQFLEDISASRLESAVSRLHTALLVLHAPNDLTVGIDNAAQIFGMAKHPKSFVSLDNADHLISKAGDAEYVAELVAAWARRYLGVSLPPMPVGSPDGVVRVSEVESGGFRQDVAINGKHHLLVDEPVSVGGTDMGPTPYQLLSAGLGACTTMTLRMYAARKNLPLAHVQCDVTHNKSHMGSQTGEGAVAAKVDVFTRVVRLEGSLTEAQRQELLGVADRCPVHRTLHTQASIQTLLAN